MKNKNAGYKLRPFGGDRRLVSAVGSAGRRQNNIQTLIEVDVSKPRQLISTYRSVTGEQLSLTAYIITCLARAIADFPEFSAFRRGRNLVALDDVTIGVLMERELDGEIISDTLGIQAAQDKTHRCIHEEIRSAQR